jgi:hypothetical protein
VARRVAENVEAYDPGENDEIVGQALEAVGAATDPREGESFALDELNRASAEFTEAGNRLLQGKCALSEILFALRRWGYRDTGNPGTPMFEKRK